MRRSWPLILMLVACGRLGLEPLLAPNEDGGLDAPEGRGSQPPQDLPDGDVVEGGAGGTTPGAGGTTPGAGGTTPGAGGTTPGAGGTTPGAGGATPGAGGTTPGAGGATPGAGGTTPGTGGTTPAAGGTTSPAPSAAVAPFYGIWKGTSRNGGTDYPVEISVSDRLVGERIGLFHIPTYDCGGVTTLQSFGPPLAYKETLLFDPRSGCGPAGTTSLTSLSPDSATYSFFDGKKTDRGSVSRVSTSGTIVPAAWQGLWSSGSMPKPAVLLTLLSGQVGSIAGHVLYPTMNCGGTLTLTRSAGDTLTFSQTLSHAIATCTDGNTITISPSGANLRFLWVASSGGGRGEETLTPYK